MWKSVYFGARSSYTLFVFFFLFIQPNHTNIDLFINVGILARHLTRSFQPGSLHEKETERKTPRVGPLTQRDLLMGLCQLKASGFNP